LLVPFRPVNRGLHDGTHNARSGRHRARASVVLCVLSSASLRCSGAPLWSQRDEWGQRGRRDPHPRADL